MYRQLVSRSTRPTIYLGASRVPIVSRKLTMTPPTAQGKPGPNQTPPSQPGGSNTIIILSSLGALGGLYYYYTRGQPGVDRETARREEEEAVRKVRDFREAGKNKVDSVVKQGERDYDRAKDAASEARTDLTERARQSAHEAQAKYDELKNTAERKMGDVRDRSEKKFEEGKEEVARHAHNAEKKTRGWFGWGSSK